MTNAFEDAERSLHEVQDIISDLRDRAIKLSAVREYCLELIQRGDTTPKEEAMLFEILRVSGMEALQ
jgi:hypothetical protein